MDPSGFEGALRDASQLDGTVHYTVALDGDSQWIRASLTQGFGAVKKERPTKVSARITRLLRRSPAHRAKAAAGNGRDS